MKNKLIRLFSIFILSVALISSLAACGKSQTIKYDYLVTFNYNTENLSDAKCSDQYLGVNANSLIMAPLKPDNKEYLNSSFKETQLSRYEVEAWYLPKYNADNTVAKDGDGNVVLDRKWNFSKDVVTSDITLYAKLNLRPLVSLYYDTADGAAPKREKRFTIGANVSETSVSPLKPKLEGKTFYGYYFDKDFTEPCTFPFRMGENGVNIYARFIDGENWRIIQTAQDFVRYFNASAKLYLYNDIDFAKAEWKPDANDDGAEYTKAEWLSKLDFSGEINGNGHTIKNITATISNSINSGENVGLFGRLTSTSNIHDITFDNVDITIKSVSDNPFMAAAFAWYINDGARLTNVHVKGSVKRMAEHVTVFAATTRNLTTHGITMYNGTFDIEGVDIPFTDTAST